MGKVCFSVLAIIVLSVFSCSNESLFPLDNTGRAGAEIEILSTASVFASGEVISLSVVNYDDSQTDQELIINLYSDTEQLIAEYTIEDLAEWEYMPEVEIPELEDGFYYFVFSLYEDSSTLAETRKEFFVYRDASSVVNLSSYPPVIYPDSGGLIFASIDTGGSDPYITWTMGGQIYKEGYLSSGLDQLQWHSPKQDGVYRISLELYPYKPPAGFSGISEGAGYSEIQLFVNKKQTPDPNEFSFNESQFLSLMHFRGEYSDFTDSDRDVQIIGQPVLAFEDKLFGYKMNGRNGFYMDCPVIPFVSTGILDFTFMMKGVIPFPQKGGNLFSCESGDSSFYISFSDEDRLSALLSIGSSSFSSVIPPGKMEKTVKNLALSVFQNGREIGFRWFADGMQIYESESEAIADLSVDVSEGWSQISGENGFTGLIDEFGIYYRNNEGRNSVCDGIYREMYAKNVYGDNLVFADGFDGSGPGINYRDNFSGSLYQGRLSLGKQQAAKIDGLSIHDEISSLSLSWEQANGILLNLTIQSKDKSMQIGIDYSNRTYILGNRRIPFDSDYPGFLTFSIDAGIVSLYSNGNEYLMTEFDQQDFSIMLENGSDETMLIDNIIITKESSAIIKVNRDTDSIII